MPPAENVAIYPWEVLPRLLLAGGVVGLVTVGATVPQVLQTSSGAMSRLSLRMWGRMYIRIAPKAGALKALQYGCMREVKMGLQSLGCSPDLSKMLSFGVMGTGFQSVIYNILITDMYSIYFGKQQQQSMGFKTFVCTKVMPGITWCFCRESIALGGGIVVQPYVAGIVREQLGETHIGIPNSVLTFTTGFVTGGITSLSTQWLHNTTLVAGRMAAQEVVQEAPHYTASSIQRAYQELGMSMFYLNFPQRMMLVAGAVGLLSQVDIFHRPDIRPYM